MPILHYCSSLTPRAMLAPSYWSRGALLGGVLSLASAQDSVWSLMTGNTHRHALVNETCAAEVTACNLDAVCATCWTELETSFPLAPVAPTNITCDTLDSWFTSATPLPATCYDYTAVAVDGTPNNPLSVLAFCYYGDVATNTYGLDCTSICAEQQKNCEADVDCAACLSGKGGAVATPDATYTCNMYQLWYQQTVASYPVTCDTTGTLIRDVTFCKYDVTLAIAGVTDCLAGIGATDAPTFAPTMASTTMPGVIHIEAEDFMAGDGIGYYVSAPSTDQQMNEIRTDEIVTVATLYDANGDASGYSVRAVASGDWLRYTIDVAFAGTYTPTYHIAAYDANNTATLLEDIKIVLDEGLSGDPCAEVGVGELNISPINTGNWRIFEDFPGQSFALTAGAGQVITVCLVDVTNFEFDYFDLSAGFAPSLAPSSVPTFVPTIATLAPTQVSAVPTSKPSSAPTLAPTHSPTSNPGAASITVAPTLAPSYIPTQTSTSAPVSILTLAPSQILTPSPAGDALLISETPAPSPTSSPTAVDNVDISGTPDVSSSSSGPNIALIAGVSAGGVVLLIGIGLWCRPKYKSACLGTLFKLKSAEAPSPTYDKDVDSSQAAPIDTVNSVDDVANNNNHEVDLESISLVPSSSEVETGSATLLQHVDDTIVLANAELIGVDQACEAVEIADATVVSPQQNNASHHQRAVILEAGLMAFAAVGAVASHIPWVKDIYGLCEEIVQLLEASERTSRNLTEVVSWIRQMQATLDSVTNAIGSCPDDATGVNEALAGRAISILNHVKEAMEQYARRNMLTQFLLSKKLQADLQESGKYFLEAIQALQLGLSAQQLQVTTQQLQVTAQHFEATNKLLSISMKIDDDLSDIMSVVKNNEVMLGKVILQLAARFPSLRDGDMVDEESEASTASLTSHNSQSHKNLVSDLSGSSIPDLEHLNRDFIISLHNGKASKSVPVAAVVEALERLHIAPSDIIKLDTYPVGQGGFSKVYRVKVREQIAAAKVVDLGALSAHHLQSVYKRFAKELYILSLLESPYVVSIVGATATLDELVLITEFMPRGSLRKVMDDSEEWATFSISMSLTLLLDVARGMVYLEEQGVRHRDLKSHNILVTADNHAKLIDFGLSKTCDAVTKSTETSAKGAAGGTLPWTAPELFDMSEDGTPHEGSFKSDVYSFGVVIWEILAGPKSRPWRGIPVGTLLNSVLRGRIPPLPTNALQYPELHKLMNDCMELDPSDRPAFADVCAQLIALEESHAHGQQD